MDKQYTLNTKLAIAAEAHHESLVHRYIEEGGDVNFIPDEPGLSPALVGCLRFGEINTNIFSTLLNQGAKPNIFDPTGLSPLIIAARRGNDGLEVLGALLEAGADPNARYNNQSDTPLTAAVRCSERDLNTITYLLEHGADPNTPGFNQMTPLICAAMHADREDSIAIIECLLSHGAKIDKKESRDGNTALHAAAFYKNLNVAQLLIERGASLDKKNKAGEQPVHLAVFQAAPELVSLLAKDHTKATRKKYEQASSLFYAVNSGDTDTVKTLLKESPKIQMKYLQQALYLAVAQCHKQIVKAILQEGVNPSKKTESGYPLVSAASHENADIAKLLLADGADPDIKIMINNEETVTPLHIAAGYFDQHEQKKSFHNRLPLLKAFIEAGANPDMCNERDLTPLHVALQVCDDPSVKFLLKHTPSKTIKKHSESLCEQAKNRPDLLKALQKRC